MNIIGYNLTYNGRQTQDLLDLIETKQPILISGETIKTINGISLLGEGDICTQLWFSIDDNGHLIMINGEEGTFTIDNGHLMYDF